MTSLLSLRLGLAWPCLHGMPGILILMLVTSFGALSATPTVGQGRQEVSLPPETDVAGDFLVADIVDGVVVTRRSIRRDANQPTVVSLGEGQTIEFIASGSSWYTAESLRRLKALPIGSLVMRSLPTSWRSVISVAESWRVAAIAFEFPNIGQPLTVEDAGGICGLGNIRSLRMLGLEFLEVGIYKLLAGLPLVDLEVSFSESFAPPESWFRSFTDLRRLRIQRCHSVTAQAFYGTSRFALEQVALQDCPSPTAVAILELVCGESLKSLELSNLDGAIDTWAFLSKAKQLVRLEVEHVVVSDAAMASACAHLNQVQHIGLRHVRGAERAVLRWITSLQSLLSLVLLGLDRLVDDWLEGCSFPKAVKMVRVSECPKFTGKILRSVPEGASLSELDVSKTAVESASFTHIRKASCLESLNVSYCRNVDDAALKCLAGLKLKSLDISGCNSLTSQCIEMLMLQKGLLELHLAFLGWVDDNALVEVSRCARLLEVVTISGTAVGDVGIRSLGNGILRRLNARHIKSIECSTLEYLCAHARLEVLDVALSGIVPADGLTALKGKFPDLIVVG